jgi:hypothetical protein
MISLIKCNFEGIFLVIFFFLKEDEWRIEANVYCYGQEALD